MIAGWLETNSHEGGTFLGSNNNRGTVVADMSLPTRKTLMYDASLLYGGTLIHSQKPFNSYN